MKTHLFMCIYDQCYNSDIPVVNGDFEVSLYMLLDAIFSPNTKIKLMHRFPTFARIL